MEAEFGVELPETVVFDCRAEADLAHAHLAASSATCQTYRVLGKTASRDAAIVINMRRIPHGPDPRVLGHTGIA